MDNIFGNLIGSVSESIEKKFGVFVRSHGVDEIKDAKYFTTKEEALDFANVTTKAHESVSYKQYVDVREATSEVSFMDEESVIWNSTRDYTEQDEKCDLENPEKRKKVKQKDDKTEPVKDSKVDKDLQSPDKKKKKGKQTNTDKLQKLEKKTNEQDEEDIDLEPESEEDIDLEPEPEEDVDLEPEPEEDIDLEPEPEESTSTDEGAIRTQEVIQAVNQALKDVKGTEIKLGDVFTASGGLELTDPIWQDPEGVVAVLNVIAKPVDKNAKSIWLNTWSALDEKEMKEALDTMGRMGGPLAAGPGGQCVCPACGVVIDHTWAEPCYKEECPECGARMTRKE